MTDTENPAPEEDAETTPKKRAPRKKTEVEEPAAEENTTNSVLPSTPYAVVGNAETDPVYLSKARYDMAAKKSLTNHHVQRRLNELGYTEAYADRDGQYGTLTQTAVARYQDDLGFEPTGVMDQGTFSKLFDGDPNVTVHIYG